MRPWPITDLRLAVAYLLGVLLACYALSFVVLVAWLGLVVDWQETVHITRSGLHIYPVLVAR